MQAKAEKKALREVLEKCKQFRFFIMNDCSKKNHLEKIGKDVKLNVKKLERYKKKKERSKKN